MNVDGVVEIFAQVYAPVCFLFLHPLFGYGYKAARRHHDMELKFSPPLHNEQMNAFVLYWMTTK